MVVRYSVASVSAVRYVDIRFMKGNTADGVSATLANWQQHAGILAATSLLAWIAVHLGSSRSV